MPSPDLMQAQMQQMLDAQLNKAGPYRRGTATTPLDAQPMPGAMPAPPADMPMPGAPAARPPAQAPAPTPPPAAAAQLAQASPPAGMIPGQMSPSVASAASPMGGFGMVTDQAGNMRRADGQPVGNSPEAMAARKADMDRINQNLMAAGLPTSGAQADGSWNMRIENGGETSVQHFPAVGIQQGKPVGIGVAGGQAGASVGAPGAVPPMAQLAAAPGAAQAALSGMMPASGGSGGITDYQSFAQANQPMLQARANLAQGFGPDAQPGSFRLQKQPDGSYKQVENYADPNAGRPEFNQQLAQQTAMQNEAALRAKVGLGGEAGLEALKQQGAEATEKMRLQAVQQQNIASQINAMPPGAATPEVIQSMVRNQGYLNSLNGSPVAQGGGSPPQTPGGPAPGGPGPGAPPPPQATSPQEDLARAAAAKTVGPEVTAMMNAAGIKGGGPMTEEQADALAQQLATHDTVGKYGLDQVAQQLREAGGGKANVGKALEMSLLRHMNDAGHTFAGGYPTAPKTYDGGLTVTPGPVGVTTGRPSNYNITYGGGSSDANLYQAPHPWLSSYDRSVVPPMTQQQTDEANRQAGVLANLIQQLRKSP
jgi:hypothetical protein